VNGSSLFQEVVVMQVAIFRPLGLILLLLLIAGTTYSQTVIPDPANCRWDSRLGRSPKNVEVGDPRLQYVFRGTLIDEYGAPVVFWPAMDIELEIMTPCQNPIVLNPDADSNPDGSLVWGAGKLDQGGGSCAGSAVVELRIVSLGVVYHRLDHVTSPDQDGDGLINLRDLGALQEAFFPPPPGPLYRADLNLDGEMNIADLGFLQSHFFATAP
jgi:hypothetical protein